MCSDLTVAKGEFDEDISHPDSKVGQTCDSEFRHVLVAANWLSSQPTCRFLKLETSRLGCSMGTRWGVLRAA